MQKRKLNDIQCPPGLSSMYVCLSFQREEVREMCYNTKLGQKKWGRESGVEGLKTGILRHKVRGRGRTDLTSMLTGPVRMAS